MEYVDLRYTHEPSDDQKLWLNNAVFDPEEPGVHMVGSSVEWLEQYWPHLDKEMQRKTLQLPTPGERIKSPSGKILDLTPGEECIHIADKSIPLQGAVADGAVIKSTQGDEVKLDQVYINAGFSQNESEVFIEYHVMVYEERYQPGHWDYDHRVVRRDVWLTSNGELSDRQEISQY